MAIPVNDNIKVNAPKPSDPRYFAPDNTPWASVEAVEAGIPLTERYENLPVSIMGVEYWWKDGEWVLKLPTITGTRIIDAYNYGFSPLATGETNSIAINNALALGGKIIVSIPGVYEIDDSIVLPSNTTIEFVKGCTLKHVTPNTGRFVNTFINKGCETSTSNDNISIIGNGLKIDFNGHDGIEGGVTIPFAYQNGRISFYKVSNFFVSGIYVNDPLESYGMYFFEMTNCSYGKITDIDLERYPEDGLDFIHCHDIYVKNYRSTTGDDAIFMGSGWLGYDKSIGDTYNITIENWISDGIFRGVPSRIITTSWDNWQSGRTYMGSSEDASELCVNAGRVYRKTTNGNQVASNAPTHSTGIVTGADGIGWLVVSDTVKYTNDVYNIRYINCQVLNSSGYANWYYESPTFSQNTNTAILKDVYFDNCAFISDSGVKISDYSCFINASANISNLNIFNTTVSFKENTANLGYNSFITLNQNSAGNKIDVDNININNLNFKGFYKASRFINNIGNILTLGNVNINKSDIEVASDSDSSIILVSNKDNLKTLNISNSTIRGIGMLLFFNGSNWTLPIERVVNISNTNFFNCKKIFTHQYSYPLGMNIYYNSFGCTFTDTVNWILDNGTGDASMIILNFLGNKTNTPSKIMQFPLQYTKKLFDLDDGLAVVKDTIVDGVTTIAPSQNAVFDALALKQNIITNPITGSPFTGYIPKSNGGGVIANSLIYDTNTSVGIGTIAPYRKLTVQHTGSAYLGVNDTTNSKYSFGSEANGLVFFDDSRAAYLALFDKVNGN